MITSSRICECGQPATRSVPDRWPNRFGITLTLHLCPRCPSPDEIDQRAAEVREGWSDELHYAKHYGVSVRNLDHLMQVTFPQCRPVRLDGMVDRREVPLG